MTDNSNGAECVQLDRLCSKGKSSLRQKDVENDGPYLVYGASGVVGHMSVYQNEHPYVAVVKDGAGVGRAVLCAGKTSVLGTMQALLPKEGTNLSYLLHLVRSLKLGEDYSGSTIPHIYFKDYGKRMVPVPTVSRQAVIADILDSVERLKSSCDARCSKLDELVKSRFVEMFGDTFLNSHNYDSVLLGEIISNITSGSRGWAKYYSNEGEYFITIKNVKHAAVNLQNIQYIHAPNNKEAQRTRVKEGDVLISITADLGRTGVVTKEIAEHGAYINQHLACIRLSSDVVTPLFLAYYLESPGGVAQFIEKNQNGVKAGLNFNLVRSLRVLLPPVVLQRQFAYFVTHVDKLRAETQRQKQDLQTLYDSLAQEYFAM